MRKIVDARLEVLNQSIQTCIHQSMFRMPYVDKQINNTVFYSYGQNIFTPRVNNFPEVKNRQIYETPFFSNIAEQMESNTESASAYRSHRDSELSDIIKEAQF